MRRTALLLALCLVAPGLSGCDWLPTSIKPVAKPTQPDSFAGEVQAVFLTSPNPSDDYRDMKLLAKFGYLDPYGVYWEVPAGYVTNGASVPWYLWPALGGPYDGPYRDAAVLHDFYCEKQTYTWEKTHEMFYNASRRRGVTETRAKTMYLGLQMFGYRWPPPAGSTKLELQAWSRASFGPPPMRAGSGTLFVQAPGKTPATRIPTNEERQIFEELKGWIEREKPSLAEIQKKVEEVKAQRNLPPPPPAPPKR
jgi:uncharacterized protein DUF1353